MVVGLAGLVGSLWRRPPSYMFLTFGFGYIAYAGLSLGLTSYLTNWQSWFWQERFFLFPYEFAGALIAVGLLSAIPKRLGRGLVPGAWAAIIVVLVAAQFEWLPILNLYDATGARWTQSQGAA